VKVRWKKVIITGEYFLLTCRYEVWGIFLKLHFC